MAGVFEYFTRGLTGEAREAAIDVGAAFKKRTRATTGADARRKARAEARRINEAEVEGTLNMVGDVDLVSGANIECVGFGYQDGKYAITKSIHTVDASGGYTVSLDVRKTLTY